jgi:dsRNA-specific ribonuclease
MAAAAAVSATPAAAARAEDEGEWHSVDQYTPTELLMPDKDTRRKARQSRLSAVALAQAARDAAGGPLAKLAALHAPTGSWLAAPIIPVGAGGALGGGSGGGETSCRCSQLDCQIDCEIDWQLVDAAVELFTSCEWPCLDDLAHPLVEATGGAKAVDPVTKAAGDSSGGCLTGPFAVTGTPCCVRLGCCALVTKHRHAIVLRDVEVHTVADGRAASVAGQYAPRTIRSNIRMQGVDGWQNRPGRREAGVLPCEACALPVRSAALRALRCLPRVLWRMEHIALVHEIVAGEGGLTGEGSADAAAHALAGDGRGGGGGRGGCGVGGGSLAFEGDACGVVSGFNATDSPSNVWRHLRHLPPGTLSAALTSKGANAEAADGAPPDSRGCAHYELLEWLGDAMLELLAVVRVMADAPQAGEGLCTRHKEMLVSNLALCRDAAHLGLPELCLHQPFCAGTPLPELRRQLISRKEQADLVEALLGLIAYHNGGCVAGSACAVRGQINEGLAPKIEESGRGRRAAGRLGSALEAAGRFFDDCVAPRHPPTTQVGGAERPISVRSALRASTPAVHRPLDAVSSACRSDRAARLALALGVTFSRRLDLLHEVAFGWNRNPPFQRLELLGDAVLGFCISFELMGLRASAAEAGPPTEGELTQARSALVSNRSLGRRLVRRVGAALSLKLLRREAAAGDVDDAVGCIAPGWDVPGACAVVRASTSVRSLLVELAPPLAAEGALSDVGKQAGDVYEALVGLVLMEVDGDIDAAWRVFRGDFFEEAAGAEGEVGAAKAAESAVLRCEALYSQVQCCAKAAALEQAARAQDRAELHSEAEAGGDGVRGYEDGAQPSGAADIEMAAPATSARIGSHEQTAAGAGGGGGRPTGAPVAACDVAPFPTPNDPSAAAAAWGGMGVPVATAASQDEAGTGSHPQVEAAGYGGLSQRQDWVSRVHMLLLSNRCDPAAALENAACTTKQPPFVWRVYDKICSTRPLLGEATSYTKKKEAKNMAYAQVHAVLTLRFGDVSGEERPFSACAPAAPAVEPQANALALILEAQHNGPLLLVKPPAKRIKAPPAGPMAKAARVDAAARSGASVRTGEPAVLTVLTACMERLLDDLQELNIHFRGKIQRLATELDLPESELCALAASAKHDAPRLLHGDASVTRSAGRLFHDRLKDKVRAAVEDSKRDTSE